jgi:hypothetical protein
VLKAREEYREEATGFDLERLKFVDEAGVNLALTRLFGRAPRGERVVDSVPQNYGENVTMLGALSLSGVEALMTVNGATDGDIFLIFVREVLCPTLREGDVVICDNLGAQPLSGGARGGRGEGRAARLPAAVLAGPEPDREMLVKDQDLLTRGQGAHPRGARRGGQAGARNRDRI